MYLRFLKEHKNSQIANTIEKDREILESFEGGFSLPRQSMQCWYIFFIFFFISASMKI